MFIIWKLDKTNKDPNLTELRRASSLIKRVPVNHEQEYSERVQTDSCSKCFYFVKIFLFLCVCFLISSLPLSNHHLPIFLPSLPPNPSQIWVSRQLLAFSLRPPLMPSTSWGTSVRTSPPKPCIKETHTHTQTNSRHTNIRRFDLHFMSALFRS